MVHYRVLFLANTIVWDWGTYIAITVSKDRLPYFAIIMAWERDFYVAITIV